MLPPFRLERYFARYEFNTPFLLCSSDCESWTVEELLRLEPEASERLQSLWLGYTESAGNPALRRAIAEIYQRITPDDVLVCAGAEEVIFLWMHAALSPGDHVIVHSPCYQSLAELPLSLGCTVSPWQARAHNQWQLDFSELQAALRPNTRALVLNTPHNPTGFLMSQADFTRVCEWTDERGILLLSDEVYRELEYNPADRLPAACDVSGNAVSIGVLSKTYGLPGLRIGWAATRNRVLRERMAQVKDYTTICSSAPSELLAEIALRHRQTLASRNLQIIATNLALLDTFFARHRDWFDWQKPGAGPIAFPKLRQGDINAFCQELAQAAGVLLLPGTLYDDTGNHFRLGFGRRNLPEALARLGRFLIEKNDSR